MIYFENKLVECQNYLHKLEKKVENCNDPERIRLLEGPEETVEQIIEKLAQVFYLFKFSKIILNMQNVF